MPLSMTSAEYEKKYGVKAFTPTFSEGATGSNPVLQPEKPMPLLTGNTTGFGGSLATAGKDLVVGAGKSFVRGGRDIAGLAQSAGKGLLGLFGADTSQMGIKSIDNSTPEGKQVDEQLQSKSRGEQVGGAIETGLEFLVPASKAKNAYNTYKEGKEAKLLTETLSPKLTSKEAQLAQKEGRFVEGKKSSLFRGGTADTITPSKKTLSASETIKREIPNASKMSPSELYTSVDNKITETAQKLRPQMEATPIKPETIEKINTDWKVLKETQIKNVPATEEVNVLKRQKQFEELLQKSGNKSYADLWDTAINYDKSIADNVKKANSLSSESLQIQKQQWLENRKILSEAIEKSSKPEFKQMSDMYDAMHNLLSKTKLNLKVDPSKIRQVWDSKTGKFIRNVTKLGVGGGIVKHELGL